MTILNIFYTTEKNAWFFSIPKCKLTNIGRKIYVYDYNWSISLLMNILFGASQKMKV